MASGQYRLGVSEEVPAHSSLRLKVPENLAASGMGCNRLERKICGKDGTGKISSAKLG
jgi:hypothetical protein